jgi:hypothetical protein
MPNILPEYKFNINKQQEQFLVMNFFRIFNVNSPGKRPNISGCFIVNSSKVLLLVNKKKFMMLFSTCGG